MGNHTPEQFKDYGVILDGRKLIDGEPFAPGNLGVMRGLAARYGVDLSRCVGVRVRSGEGRVEFTSVASAAQVAHVTEHGERFQVRRFAYAGTTAPPEVSP
jgi:hypothetical protein